MCWKRGGGRGMRKRRFWDVLGIGGGRGRTKGRLGAVVNDKKFQSEQKKYAAGKN